RTEHRPSAAWSVAAAHFTAASWWKASPARSTISSSRSARWAAISTRPATGTISSRSAISSRALDYGRDGKLVAGMVGYFPEAVYYGPQSQDPDIACKTIVLQFGGASGSGYLSQAEGQTGMRELRAEGGFKDGVFRRRADVEGKRNLDGYQAIWEHVNGRPMVYPKPRYPQPVFMDPANYDWVPVEGAPGVAEKLLGVFTERRSEAGLFKLDAGASYIARGKGVYVVTRGTGSVGGVPLRPLTTLYLEPGETATITAREETELLHFGLPNLAGLRAPVRAAAPAEAAE